MTDTCEITVRTLGGLGDGIADYQGGALFIPKSCPGDHARVRITRQHRHEAQGEIIELLQAGETRVPAPCAHYSECGSCTLQHLSADAYRRFKHDRLASALRQAGFPDHAADIIFLNPATRRRADFKLFQGMPSYYRLGSHTPVPIRECLILEPTLQAMLPRLTPALKTLSCADACHSLSLTATDHGIDAVLGMAGWNPHHLPALREFASSLDLTRLCVQVKSGGLHIACEAKPVTVTVDGHAIAIPPGAFLQATREGQDLMVSFIQEALHGAKNAADLFCGVGTYSFPLSRHATVYAAEGDPVMVAQMQANIETLGLGKRLRAESRDLFTTPLTSGELSRFDAVVLNPPRVGAKRQCEMLAASKVKTAVMVSCNPATWARDARILKDSGFSLARVQGIDQFVWNPHFEIVSLFTR
jgi:23S rRNA (uracil1939-C5)-methyltransferase